MSDPRERRPRRRDERGSVLPLVIGFTAILLVLVAVVVDASAAYLKRQDLATLADGAALRGADLGAEGIEVYRRGVDGAPLRLTPAAARAAVTAYLADVGAYRDHPGLRADVTVAGDRVEVRLAAPLGLPLTVPGAPDDVTVRATGAARADPDL